MTTVETKFRYRVRALALSWRSTALWKMHDAEATEDVAEKGALRREANMAESCADHIERAVRECVEARL